MHIASVALPSNLFYLRLCESLWELLHCDPSFLAGSVRHVLRKYLYVIKHRGTRVVANNSKLLSSNIFNYRNGTAPCLIEFSSSVMVER